MSFREDPEWQEARAVMEPDFDSNPDELLARRITAAIKMREVEMRHES